jgi:hypothetical protein
MRSNIVELDALLGGGIEQGSSTLVLGPAGSGKRLSLSSLWQRPASGEKAAIFAFDEELGLLFDRTKAMQRVERGTSPAGSACWGYSVRRTRAGRGSQGCLLCSSGCHRFANFQSYRFIVAALCLTSSSLRRKPLSGPTLPGLGGIYLFLPSLSPEAKEGGSRF